MAPLNPCTCGCGAFLLHNRQRPSCSANLRSPAETCSKQVSMDAYMIWSPSCCASGGASFAMGIMHPIDLDDDRLDPSDRILDHLVKFKDTSSCGRAVCRRWPCHINQTDAMFCCPTAVLQLAHVPENAVFSPQEQPWTCDLSSFSSTLLFTCLKSRLWIRAWLVSAVDTMLPVALIRWCHFLSILSVSYRSLRF